MKTYFISKDNDTFERCILQCCCIGECGFLTLYKSDDLINAYYIDIHHNNIRYYKNRNRMLQTAYLIPQDLKLFVTGLKNIEDRVAFVPFQTLKKDSKYLYILLMEKEEDDYYQLSILESLKKKQANKTKCIFDILINKQMLNKFIKVLDTWLIPPKSDK